MKTYELYFDDNNVLCIKIDEQEFLGEECNTILNELNDLEVTNSKASNRTVYLYNESTTVIIRDIQQFEKSKIFEKVPKLFENFNNTLMENNKKELKKFQRLNNKKKFILVSTTSLALILLSSAVNHKISRTIDESEIETEKDMEEYQIDELDYEEAVNSIKTERLQSQAYYDRLAVDGSINGEREIIPIEYNHLIDLVQYSYDNYYEDVERIANRWGLSPDMMMGILIHESGNGKEKNLMQIHFRYLEEQKVNLYDFEQQKMRTIIFTNHPEQYYGLDVTCITAEDMKNTQTNISAACILFRYNLALLNNHIGASIQCYNLGYARMMRLLKTTSENTGQSIEEMLSDQANVDFINYANTIDLGDPKYIRNVVKYTRHPSFTIQFVDENGNIYEETIEFENQKKK